MSLYQPPQPHTHRLVSAVLRLVHSTHYADESSPHWDAEREYSAEQVALAARALTRSVDALPENQRPIGWGAVASEGEEDKQSTEGAELRSLLGDFVDPDPCHFDHHGYCQAHFWLQTEPACPHARAKELLANAPKENRPA